MPFKSALGDELYNLWMCRDCGVTAAKGTTEADDNVPTARQEVENHGLQCEVCGNKGMERLILR